MKDTYYVYPWMRRFGEQLIALEDSLRRARRPRPANDPAGSDDRKWAAVVLQAEIKHATDDFWRCVYVHGAGLLFDHHQRDREAAAFRFEHEARAGLAWAALGDLNIHRRDARGPWSRAQAAMGARAAGAETSVPVRPGGLTDGSGGTDTFAAKGGVDEV